ncbi:MAG: glutamine amidotransferase, partial [Alphaproteobacteria bacterium]
GYYSFQGINGAARYHRTPIEDLLPVSMLPHDDRVEVPEGFEPVVVAGTDHPVLQGLGGNWPYLLGFNEVRPKEEATVLAETGEAGAPLLVTGTHGAGRTMAWTSDIGPHWLPPDFIAWPGYAQLWRQAFTWLAGR